MKITLKEISSVSQEIALDLDWSDIENDFEKEVFRTNPNIALATIDVGGHVAAHLVALGAHAALTAGVGCLAVGVQTLARAGYPVVWWWQVPPAQVVFAILLTFAPDVLAFLEKKIVRLVHSAEYIHEVKSKCSKIKEPDTAVADQANDIYYCNQSYKAACLAALATIRGLETVLKDDSEAEKI